MGKRKGKKDKETKQKRVNARSYPWQTLLLNLTLVNLLQHRFFRKYLEPIPYLCHKLSNCLLSTFLFIFQYFVSLSKFIQLLNFLHDLLVLSSCLSVDIGLCLFLCYILLEVLYLTLQVFASLLVAHAFWLCWFTLCFRNFLFSADKPSTNTKELVRIPTCTPTRLKLIHSNLFHMDTKGLEVVLLHLSVICTHASQSE